MGCACNDPITDWYALKNYVPRNPFDIIAYAEFVGLEGTFEYSSDYLTGGATFTTSPLSINNTKG